MSWSELETRARQEASKRLDVTLSKIGVQLGRDGLRSTSSLPGKFFFSTNEISQRIGLLRERLPHEAQEIVAEANEICRHHFRLLGYRDLDYGPEIDWHLDAVHGLRSPLIPWFKINFLDFAAIGDHKVTWELSRHQHLVTLAKAWLLTGRETYAQEILAQWYSWQRANPYPLGVNWASSLEVAFRSLSWIWLLHLLAECPVVPASFRDDLVRGLALNGRHIERYLSTYFSPNTHLLGEAVALFFIGTLCPQIRSAPRWKRRGWEMVLRESERQVRPDGFYFEQSTYYHVYALDFLIHASVLASLNDMPFPTEYNRRLERMLDALAVLCRAGAPPRWGDDDGGRVFDPLRNRAEHLSDPLATGAVLFGRGDFKLLVGGLREETLWLLGEKGAAKFDRIEAKKPEMRSVAAPDTGLYVMSCNQRKLQAVIDAGPQGALAGGHGHADALSLTLHAEERELLGDPGTYEYVGAGRERDQFRGTSAHNTFQLDGRNQSEPRGPFAWQRFANAKAEIWVTGETFDLFVGSHDGYSQPGTPAIHRRWVFFRKPKFWLVRDLMLGTGKHELDLRWHLNPELSSPEQGEDRFFCFGEKGGVALFSAEGHCWSKTVQPGIWSAAYGSKESATEVRFTTATTLPAEFTTLLAPLDLSPEDVRARGRLSQFFPSPDVSAYRFIDHGDEHYFIFAQEKNWTFDEWKSDAEFFYCCRTDGKLTLLVFCNGTHVEFRESRIVSSPRRMIRCELFYSQGKMQVDCSEDDILISQEWLSKSVETGKTVPQGSNEADR